ncbi:LamG-like jellyroll fold domain-containing protein [Nonomuraea sp. NPDC050663]|uniref:LamG-like jellyroll fold domain-containing protein n=1 Tax=Nonomuraea sp. NPDC050663 TaxID=3364370 RepID=UPI003796FE0C
MDVPEAVVDQFQVTPSRIVDGGTVTSSLTPTLHARVTDPLGGASTVDVQVVQNFSPYTTVWTGSAANVASGSAAALKVAAGLLADGKEYYWQVRATTPGSTPSWSNSQTFTVDVPEAVVDQFQVTPAETLSGATRITSVTPTLHARVTDPLGGASTVDVQVVQNFSPYTTVWTGSVANVASGTQASIQVPAGKLADRKEYYWQVKATTPGSSPSWSNSQTFTVDVFDPATDPAVSQLQVVPSQQIDGVTTSSSVTPQLRAAVSHPQGSASRVEFEVEHDPAAPQGQGRGRIWTTALVGVASGSQAAVNVPQSTLADGWLVRWRTRSIVGTTTSTWSTWQQLQVAVPKPGVGQFQVTPSSVVDGKTVTTVLTPALHAQVTYAPGGELKAEFEVEHDPSAPEGQGSGPIWTGTVENVPAGTQTSVAVPAGELADGWAVRWRVRSSAGTLISPWSDWQSLLVDRPDSAPAVQDPQVTPSAQVDGRTVASTVTPQLRATLLDPRGDDLTAEFEVEHDPAAPDGQGSGPIWAGDVAGVAVGSQAVLAVPGGVLSDGWVVRWRARAASASVTSPWSDWQLLTVDVPKPGLGEVRVTPSSVVEGKTVTPVLTPSLYAQVTYAPGGAMRAEFEMEHDPGAPAGQGSGQIWAASVEGDANTQVVASVPVGELSDGWTVRWRVRSLAADLTSPWSAWQQLVVDRPESAPGVEDLQVTPCKTVNGQTVTNTVTPQLRATPTDPRGDALTAEFEIEHDPSAPDGQGNGPIWAGAVADAQPGSPASLAVPLGKLTDGWLVRWRARAVSPSTASPWSGWQVLKVDVIHPGEEPLAQTDGPVIRTDESFTVAAWLKWSDKDGAYSVIEQKGAHQAPFKLGNDPEDGLVFTFTSADTADATVDGVRSGVEPPVNEWFHLAGVYDSAGNTATLYLNGVNVGAASLSSTRWHADAALSLGARAVGGLDDVWVYQRPLTSDDIASLLMAGETPTPAPATGKASETAGTLSEPDPYEVNYRHFTLDTCRSKAPKEAIWGIWTDATVFSGCSVRWFGISMWMDDLDYPSGSGKKKRIKLPDGSEGLDMIVRSTVVMNSYLGTRDGTSIRKLGSDGVTGPLSPKEFSMWVAFDQLDFALETGIGNSRMKLAVTAASGTDGATCSKTVNGDREALVKDWDDTTRYFRFKSESTTSKVRTCSVSPWVEVKDLVTNVGPSSFPLWGKLKDEQPKGIWTPPTVRCDDLTLGPGAPGNWPEEKRVRYTGACIFPDVSRIYRTDVDHSKRGPVAAHIWAAFNDTDNTEPKKAPGQKIVPGNWDGKTPATRAALTRINESALRPGDPRGRTWGAVQVSERRKACRAAKVVGDCDEFPFNSVKEGPGWGDGNFSVRGVPSANNKSDGWYLSVFYARYRVLIPEGPDRPNGDRFWVSVKGTP